MAHLGHTARIIISCDNLEDSIDAWERIGFVVESTFQGIVRITDGQVLVTLLAEEFDSPALAYFNSAPEILYNSCLDSGLRVERNEKGVVKLSELLGLDVYVHPREIEEQELPSGEQSPLFGYFDGLAVAVDDVTETRMLAEDLGFFVQEEWFGDTAQSDVTDGLMLLSLRSKLATPMLTYSAHIDEDLIQSVTQALGSNAEITRHESGRAWFVRLRMPEGTLITIAHEDE